jgi:uncharacterized glyoxalase superfamily protein PhnB
MPGTVPPDMRSITPHISIQNCAAAIEFYKKAFGASEGQRLMAPDGKRIMHTAITIGDSMIMLNDDFPEYGGHSAASLKGTPVTLHLYVTDADAAFDKAVAAGAKVVMPIADMFWGDRYGIVEDPFGNKWSIAHHIKDMSPAEMESAMKNVMSKDPC